MELKTLNFNPINEKISFKYSIPKNKSQLMYDFYLLTALPLWGLGGVKGTTRPHPEGPAMEMLAKDAQKNIVNFLKKDLLEVVLFSLASEFRHALSFGRISDILKYMSLSDLIKYVGNMKIIEPDKMAHLKRYAAIDEEYRGKWNYLDSYLTDEAIDKFYYITRFRRVSYNAILKTWSKDKFVKMAAKIFSDSMWATSSTPGLHGTVKRRWGDYGGPAWSNIAKGWLKLKAASSYDDKVVYIDHIFDLQHNTDSVLNKSSDYADEFGNHNWIRIALDSKKHAKSLFDLVNDASPAAKSFSARVVKAATGETYDKWYKQTFEYYAKFVR